jgi:phosphoglucomutase
MDEFAERRAAAVRQLQAWEQSGQILPSTKVNAERWLTGSGYREFWPALCDVIESANVASLQKWFWERIPFGTGGRRGPMAELGSATINRRTIAESAFGLGSYVRHVTGLANPSAAIACDTRINSQEFAQVTARVLAALGFTVHLYQSPRSTPQLSFTVRRLVCHCGVMISASHNPPADNGFKAYWSHGGQVLPPHDQGIIAAVDAAEEITLADFDTAVERGQIVWIPESIDEEFVSAVAAMSLSQQRSIRALYTPLHGVGETSVAKVLQRAGFEGVSLFELQRSQDGRFPHVPQHLPNPERTAVFDPAISAARDQDIDLILASDPDADRMAVAVRSTAGGFVCLTGNQMGALLTDYVLSKRQCQGTLSSQHYVIETLVTTPLTAAIGQSYGVRVFCDLPVGFKHIAATIEREGVEQFVFATEESIGFLAGDYCRDKDASVAALWILELAAELKAEGKTLLTRLDELYGRFGMYREAQVSREIAGPAGAAHIAAIVRRCREQPPTHFGSVRWQRLRDYGQQTARRLPGGETLPPLPVNAGDLLFLDGQNETCSVQLAMRPSGTEPKIKFYVFVQAPPEAPLADARVWTDRTLQLTLAALEEWIEQTTRGSTV